MFHSLARCVAGPPLRPVPRRRQARPSRLVVGQVAQLRPRVKVLAFLAAGRRWARWLGPGPQRELKAVLLEALGSPSEDVRQLPPTLGAWAQEPA